MLAAGLLCIWLLFPQIAGAAVFSVSPDNPGDHIWANGWPADTQVTVTVDDLGNGIGDDYSQSASTDASGNVAFTPLGYDVQPGHVVRVSDTVTTRETTVVAISVDGFDLDADTVWGSASAGATLTVNYWDTGWNDMLQRSVTVTAGGTWLADFGTSSGGMPQDRVGDLQATTVVTAMKHDDDGDATQTNGSPPNPSIGVHCVEDTVGGWMWDPDTDVTITLEDTTTPASPDFTMGAHTDGDGNLSAFADGFDIVPGTVVYATDGAMSTVHTATALTLEGVDPALDLITGTAEPFTTVLVNVNTMPWRQRQVEADAGGNWSADFTDSVGGQPQDAGYDIVAGDNGSAFQSDDDGDQTQVFWSLPNPCICVDLSSQSIRGWQWPANTSLMITINDPTVPGPFEYLATPTTDDQGNLDHALDPDLWSTPGLELAADQVVTVTDGEASTKTHTVFGLSLTGVDPELDTVSGGAEAGTDVTVQLHAEWPSPMRTVTATDGTWVARFTEAVGPNPQDGPYDITLGSQGEAQQSDGDGDCTCWQWRVAAPSFGVAIAEGDVFGGDWAPWSTVTIDVDDLGTPEPVDFETTAETDGQGGWGIGLQGQYDLQPGFVVSVTDGASSKEHTVTALAISGVDPDTDIIGGTAAPFTHVVVQAWDEWGPQRETDADADGNWAVSFATTVSEEPWGLPYDLTPGCQGEAVENDDDNDSTHARWRVPNPNFGAWPEYEQLNGGEWDPFSELTVMIEEESAVTTFSAESDEWGNFNFDVAGMFDIMPGQVVTVSDGLRSKVHTVVALGITSVDPGTDIITGTAEPGLWLWVACYTENVSRQVQASEGGTWAADFSQAVGGEDWQQAADITLGSDGGASFNDEDNDFTMVDWRVPAPWFAASPDNDGINGADWPAGQSVTITIEDSSTPESPDLSTSVDANEWGEFDCWVGNALDLSAGLYVTVQSGETSKEHTVTDLQVSSVDTSTDTVYGTAAPGAEIWVSVWDKTEGQGVVADENGDWFADFSVAWGPNEWEQPVDIVSGDGGNASENDDDGDSTQFEWYVPNPAFAVDLANLALDAWDWPPSAEITITIDDPVDPDVVYHTAADETGWFWFENDGAGIDVSPGATVTVTDGSTSKVLVVRDLAITGIDPASGLITGTIVPDLEVVIDAWTQEEGQTRWCTPVDGNWAFDFSQPDGGNGPLTLVQGTGGQVYVSDEDGDMTKVSWNIPNPSVQISPVRDEMWGDQWPDGATLMITYHPSAGGSDFTTTTVADGGWLWFSFYPEGIDIVPGDVLTVTDGDTVRTHTVTALTVTDVDAEADTVSGGAEPGSMLGASIDGQYWGIEVWADAGTGEWLAEFMYDITEETWGSAFQYDDNNCATVVQWHVLRPRFTVDPVNDTVWGEDWPGSVELDVTFDDPAVPGSPDLTTTAYTLPWGAFDLSIIGTDLAAGDVVTVSDGSVSKVHTVTALTVDGVDIGSDVVYGTSDATGTVRVNVWWMMGECYREAGVGVGGDWAADFSTEWPTDLVFGSEGDALQFDEDDDATDAQWSVVTPAPADDDFETLEDTPLYVAPPGILGNDTYNPMETVIETLTAPSHGDLTLNPLSGDLYYVPDTDWNGADWFTYRLTQDGYESASAIVTITVAPDGEPPATVVDTATVAEDTTLTVPAPGVLGNDPAGLTILDLGVPDHGTLTMWVDGAYVYRPDPDWYGIETVWYRATDGSAWSLPTTLTITVTPVNDAPVAVEDAYTVAEDTTLTVNAAAGWLANDSDVDSGTLVAIRTGDPAHAASWSFSDNGSFTYKPAANWSGVDHAWYYAYDGSLGSTGVTVTITVTAVNDAPVAVADTATVAEDTTLTVPVPGVFANDSDVDGPTMIVSRGTGPFHGNIVVYSNGSYEYRGDADYTGSDQWAYRVFDGSAYSGYVTVTIAVTPVNDAPVAVDDTVNALEGTARAISALANDTDVDGDTLSVGAFGQPAHGAVTSTTTGFTYTPQAGYNGPDSFTYKAFDGAALSASATVGITVSASNDPPVAVNDAATGAEDTTLTVPAPGPLGNDTDPEDDALEILDYTGPLHGTLSLSANGSYTYRPTAGWSGTDTFTYRATDGMAPSGWATVTITVAPVNDPPVAVNDVATVAENTTLTVAAPGVLANDSDVDSEDMSAVLATGPAHGALNLSANGSYTYRPATDWFGTDTFTYRAADGTATSVPATVTITVTSGETTFVAMSGANRWETCVRASQHAFSQAGTIIIATGQDWPDALGGAALAGAYDAPILLVNAADVPPAIEAEVQRLDPTQAIIIGGTGVVTNAVRTELLGLMGAGSEVTRVAGLTRYETARLVAEATIARKQATGGWDGTFFVATGANYPDALGASPAAAAKGWPIVLSSPLSGIDSATRASLDAKGATDAYILGGTGAVPLFVETSQLPGIGVYVVDRFSGIDRYETAAKVAVASVDDWGMHWSGVALATGEGYADALSGGPMQGREGSVMLLTKSATLSPFAQAALVAHKAEISEVVYLGGTGVLTPAVRAAVVAALD